MRVHIHQPYRAKHGVFSDVRPVKDYDPRLDGWMCCYDMPAEMVERQRLAYDTFMKAQDELREFMRTSEQLPE